jgi:mannose-6-phosphate isomerase-like protein (cupin superfamily)
MPANVRHWFRATGSQPLITLGVHASSHRIVDVHEE